MKNLEIMADPINKGLHTLHDNRYIVTEGTKVSVSPHVPNDWTVTEGSIICRLTDCQEQAKYAALIAAAPDLLAVAKRYVKQLEDIRAEMNAGKPTDIQYCLAIEAIDKAEFQKGKHITKDTGIATREAAERLKKWWGDHKYDTYGEHGGHNTFDNDDEAVFQAVFDAVGINK